MPIQSPHKFGTKGCRTLLGFDSYKDLLIFGCRDGPKFKGEIMCELCGSEEGIRRDDNIHVCDECDNKYPVREPDEDE